jgi:hypothetical protein
MIEKQYGSHPKAHADGFYSRWFQGSAKLVTCELEELLGTKLRALYQRKKRARPI